MRRSATARAGRSPDLQPAQFHALACLAGGSSVTDAAEGAGVDRTTVHRWLREDVVFQASEFGPEDPAELREDLTRARKEREAIRANRKLMIFL